MSKKWLLNLFALSCLANASGPLKAAPPKDSVVSVTSQKGSASANKNKGNFLIEHKNDFMIGSLSALGGAAAGGGFGYLLGGRETKFQLEKANKDKLDLQSQINSLTSTISSKDSEIAKYKDADNSIQKLEQQIEDLKSQLNQEKDKVAQKEQKIVELTNNVTQKDAEINLKNTALQQKDNQLKSLNEQLTNAGGAQAELAKANETIIKLQNDVMTKDQKINALNATNNTLTSAKTSLETEKNNLQEAIGKANAILGFDVRTGTQDNEKKSKLQYKLGKILYKVLKTVGGKDGYKIDTSGTDEKKVPFALFGAKYFQTSDESTRNKMSITKAGLFSSSVSFTNMKAYTKDILKLPDKENKKNPAVPITNHYVCGLANVTVLIANELQKLYGEPISCELSARHPAVKSACKRGHLEKLPKLPPHYYIENIDNPKEL